MGYQLKDVCYDTQQQAIDAYFLSQPINFQTSFDSSFTNTDIFFFQKYESQWFVCRQNSNSNQTSNCVEISSPTLTNCEYASDPTSQFLKGMELGSAVAGVIVIAFVWRYLRVRH